MAKQEVMTVAGFKQLLKKYSNEVTDDFQVWLSSDEEGNEFLPMLKNPNFLWRSIQDINGSYCFLLIGDLFSAADVSGCGFSS